MIQEHNDAQAMLIEQNLQSFAAKGVARKPSDVEACLCCRNALFSSDQQIFDDLLRAGTFAGSAANMVEMLAGREQPQGSAQTPVGAGIS